MNAQLNLIEKIEEIKIAEMPYRNAMGELLPWEKPKYTKQKRKIYYEQAKT